MMFRMLDDGQFGNSHTRYYSVEQWLNHLWTGKDADKLWAIQTVGKPGSRCDYNLSSGGVLGRLGTTDAEALSRWGNPYAISYMMPDNDILCQGELWGDYLNSSTKRVPIRMALREAGEHRYGATVRLYLRSLMNPGDYEDLMELADKYPGHAIEWGYYSSLVGKSHRQLMIWEVRNY